MQIQPFLYCNGLQVLYHIVFVLWDFANWILYFLYYDIMHILHADILYCFGWYWLPLACVCISINARAHHQGSRRAMDGGNMDYQREEIWLACAHKYFIFLPEILAQIKRNPHNAIEEWPLDIADQEVQFPKQGKKVPCRIKEHVAWV